MLKNIWTVTCDRVLIDSGTKMVSLIDCIDQGKVHEFPAKLPGLHVAARWISDFTKPEKAEAVLVIEDPGGKKEEISHHEMEISENNQISIHIPQFIAQKPGEHLFYLAIKHDNEMHLGNPACVVIKHIEKTEQTP